MFPLKLPFDLGDVLLTPQWSGLLIATMLIAAVCLVPLVLVLSCIATRCSSVARPTALGLLSARATVLALLLVLVCLQPIYGRTPHGRFVRLCPRGRGSFR